MAKILELPYGRNILYKKLRVLGVYFKNRNEPKQKYVEAGYFKLKEHIIPRKNYPDKLFIKVLVTQMGIGVVNYISMIRRSDQYEKIPLKAWERFRDFVNSGETIENYNIEKMDAIKIQKIKPEVKVKIEGGQGKYTLFIDIEITLNGKKIII
ncbi:hypothetical protein ES705_31437 [subsurface metagenome]